MNTLTKQTNVLYKDCVTKQDKLEEIQVYKQNLAFEIQNEMRLNSDISKICNKYKKLIADQKKDKEKMNA